MWNNQRYSQLSYSWLDMKLEMLFRGVITKRMCVVDRSVLKWFRALGLEKVVAPKNLCGRHCLVVEPRKFQ